MKVERRTVPGETVELVEAEIRALAPGAKVTAFFAREPLATPADAPVVEAIRAAAARVLGSVSEPIGVPFWTDAALLAAAGIPTVIFGPGGDGAHADVEWVDLDDVERLVEILVATAGDLCR
jgi:acetylornithine deacetylase